MLDGYDANPNLLFDERPMLSVLPRCASLLFALSLLAGCNKAAAPSAAKAKARPLALETGKALRDRLDSAVAFARDQRHLDVKTQAAWQVVHGILCYGPNLLVYDDDKLVPAVDYLMGGGKLKGWNLRKGDHGVEAVLEAGSKTGQGHEDQWLGYLSQSGIPLDQQLVVDGEKFHVRDLLTQAQWDIYEGMEATWTLMALTTYLKPFDTEWKARDGSKWNVERVVNMEASQSLDQAPCGGSHRMYALAIALDRHKREGGQITGGWQKAKQKIDDAKAKAREYQQSDGTFSVNFFGRSASSSDIEKRIHATGHTLEFLIVSSDNSQLEQPWVRQGVASLLGMLDRTRDFSLECGALYHAAHALKLYRERFFGPPESTPKPATASVGDPAKSLERPR